MKLSKHDKNMIAMSWLAEVLLNGLAQIKDAPEHKQEQYDELQKNYETALQIIIDINHEFAKTMDVVFGEDFKNDLVDLTTIIGILYQTQDAKTLLKFMKWVGYNSMLQNEKEKETTKGDES